MLNAVNCKTNCKMNWSLNQALTSVMYSHKMSWSLILASSFASEVLQDELKSHRHQASTASLSSQITIAMHSSACQWKVWCGALSQALTRVKYFWAVVIDEKTLMIVRYMNSILILISHWRGGYILSCRHYCACNWQFFKSIFQHTSWHGQFVYV